MNDFPDVHLFIDGKWRDGGNGSIKILNPATEEFVGVVASASNGDLEDAVRGAVEGFSTWRRMGVFERSNLMKKAAENLRKKAEYVSAVMTVEQGKPLAESRLEVLAAADTIDWFAEEARRCYGKIVPSRSPNVLQQVILEPIGVVAAFTPWNFPINQAVRKVSAALASGCSIILKGPEETPASCAELVSAFEKAGIPRGVVSLVFGDPEQISGYLTAHRDVQKISFTGSTAVGKKLAALAGSHMKRVTMELGGHAPVLVFDDVDVTRAVHLLATAKFRNAGQVCIAPTRFLVHANVYNQFVKEFATFAGQIKTGKGDQEGVAMGPLANERRLIAVGELTQDAVQKGATLVSGGHRIGNRGFFYAPTVLRDVPESARAMNEEPFGPLALMRSFKDLDGVIEEANRLPYGLAAYAYTSSTKVIGELSARLNTGMLSINHHGLALPELPFGGVRDSGFGSEGGSEAILPYVNHKLVTQMIV